MTPGQHMWREFGQFSGPVAGRGRALARLAPAARVTLGRSHRSRVCEWWGAALEPGWILPECWSSAAKRAAGSAPGHWGHCLLTEDTPC